MIVSRAFPSPKLRRVRGADGLSWEPSALHPFVQLSAPAPQPGTLSTFFRQVCRSSGIPGTGPKQPRGCIGLFSKRPVEAVGERSDVFAQLAAQFPEFEFSRGFAHAEPPSCEDKL